MADQLDLDKLSLDELKTLSKDIERSIRKREVDNLRRAKEAVEAVAREHGFSLEEIMGRLSAGKSATPASARYRNPNDASQTWSGRGRQPQWFKDALAAGRSLEDLAA
jgi:DNA-binding protein H-NS